MFSTRYVITFVIAMTVLVALALSLMYNGLKGIHKSNEAVYNKRAIISAVKNQLDKNLDEMDDNEVAAVFDNNITQMVIDGKGNLMKPEDVVSKGHPGGLAENVDMGVERKKPESERIYPLFVFEKEGKKNYITSVRGNGLWDAIWGNIALGEDFSTITGVSFDHQGETPGLGAEIKDNENFKKQFIGKKILDENGNFVGINVVKGGAKAGDTHAVDGLTGATITADGVEEMIENGLVKYKTYFNK